MPETLTPLFLEPPETMPEGSTPETMLAGQQVAGEQPQLPDAPTVPREAGFTDLDGTVETKATSAETQDLENRYTDAEILGKSFRVRRAVQETGTQSIKAWQGLKAKVMNAFDAPGKAIKQFAYNRAKGSYERKDARLQAATNVRLRQRRQTAADKAKDRLDDRTASLQDRVNRMNYRTQTVQENANHRRQEYIDDLKGRRENALARKAVRQQLREQGASSKETKAIIAEIAAEQLAKVGKIAIVAETSRRQFISARGTEKAAIKSHHKTEKRISRTDKRADRHLDSARQADRVVQEITTLNLPAAEEHVAELRMKLSDLDINDPDYDKISSELKKAEQNVSVSKSYLKEYQWFGERSRKKVGKAETRLDHLDHARLNKEQLIKSAHQQTTTRQATDSAHQAKLNQVINAALNPEEARKEN